MSGPNSTASPPPGALTLLFGVGLIGLLGMMGTFAWMASTWEMSGMMRGDHMGRTMGGGRDTSGGAARQGTATETIVIEDFAYSPGNLQVPVGARVTWTTIATARRTPRQPQAVPGTRV